MRFYAAEAAEVPKLRESLKGSIPMVAMAKKLEERDAEHAKNTKDLRVQAGKAGELQEEVDRLKLREQELMGARRSDREEADKKHRLALDRLKENHRKEKEEYVKEAKE